MNIVFSAFKDFGIIRNLALFSPLLLCRCSVQDLRQIIFSEILHSVSYLSQREYVSLLHVFILFNSSLLYSRLEFLL